MHLHFLSSLIHVKMKRTNLEINSNRPFVDIPDTCVNNLNFPDNRESHGNFL